MAKQKTKNPGSAGTAAGHKSGRIAADVATPAVKTGSKRKGRLRSGPVGSSGKAVPPKRVGKGKKTLRKTVAPEAAVIPPGGPKAGVPSGRRTKVHKIGRAPARLGVLERLELAVEEVRLGGRVSPRTRKLQMSGVPKMAQKVIEEAGEVAIEATLGNRVALINEAADLLYNLTVLLAATGVSIDAVWSEMDRRVTLLGIAEKLPKTTDVEG